MCPFAPYADPEQIIPPFSNYISIRKNFLSIEDDCRTYLPYNGDNYTYKPDTDIHKLEEKIQSRRQDFETKSAIAERAKLWTPYALEMLSRVECRPRDVVEFLGHPRDLEFLPQELPSELDNSWKHFKGLHGEDRKQLKDRPVSIAEMIEMLPNGSSSRQLVSACILNQAFFNVTGIDMFQIFKPIFIQSLEIPKLTTEGGPIGLRPSHPYIKLECLLCHAHNCPGHGEFEEEDGVSQRIRVAYVTSANAERNANSERKEGGQHAERFLGLGEDGTVSGPEWTRLLKEDQSWDDQTPCSDDCFWLQRNRTRSNDEWSPEERQAFEAVYLAYRHDRRGSCMMAELGICRKSCVNVSRPPHC